MKSPAPSRIRPKARVTKAKPRESRAKNAKHGGTRRGAGKPAFKPSRADRETVTTLVACGVTHDDIALCIGKDGVDPVTLRKHFRRELAVGTTKVNLVCGRGIVKAMKKGEAWALRLWSARMAGFNVPRVEDATPGLLWDEFVAIYRRRVPASDD